MSDHAAKARQPQIQDVEVRAVATSLDGMRKEATVALVKPGGKAFTIVCDEGPDLGGDDSAPPPLSYFASAVAF